MKTVVFLSHFDGNLYLFRLPIMRYLANNGYRVIALVPSGEYSDLFAQDKIEHIDYKIKRSSLNPFSEIAVIFRLTRILKRVKPDILHCFTIKPNLYGAIAGRLAGVKTIYATVTGLGSFFIDDSLKAKIVKNILLLGYYVIGKLCAKVLFQNSDDLNLFTQKKIVKVSKTLLIGSSGVDTNFWQKTKRGKKDKVTILFVGRLIKHKGILEFLKAARNLKNKHGDLIEFVIVGGGDKGNLFSLDSAKTIARNNRVVFEGEQKDIKPYYQAADIFVLPSYREGVSRSILEAMSMSLPIVTTNAVGCRDTIEDQIGGFLIPIGDDAALEEAIERLFNDQKLRVKMGKAARKRAVERFDVKAVVERYAKLY
ncbi:MAG: glycosyltransferase family 4 protein [Helicobacteraceae bacterium]|jgi:N,N'-diacetylbacillosaminyl-diphospho-undecaprenol alpha-1,3-N-acetylgalactosaminyltransferase|nr:glycosyltransferase family 4 protein [Helicobacteraceae bacterium]